MAMLYGLACYISTLGKQSHYLLHTWGKKYLRYHLSYKLEKCSKDG